MDKKRYLVLKKGVAKVIDTLIIILFFVLTFVFNPLSMYIFYLDEKMPAVPFILIALIGLLAIIRDIKIEIKTK